MFTEAYKRGQEEARRDLRVGTLKFKSFGRPTAAHCHFARLLLAETGVRVDDVANCYVPTELLEESCGYNSVVEAHLDQQFGQGALQDIRRRAGIWYQNEPFLDNGKPCVEVSLDAKGNVRCPNCKKKFSIRKKALWNGSFHRACGQRLLIRDTPLSP